MRVAALAVRAIMQQLVRLQGLYFYGPDLAGIFFPKKTPAAATDTTATTTAATDAKPKTT